MTQRQQRVVIAVMDGFLIAVTGIAFVVVVLAVAGVIRTKAQPAAVTAWLSMMKSGALILRRRAGSMKS